MKILIENGCPDLKNMGDVAMLQVAIIRLRELWPDALIYVITSDPDRLSKYFNDVVPVSFAGRSSWFQSRHHLLGWFQKFVPGFIYRKLFRLEQAMWCRWLYAALFSLRLKKKFRKRDVETMEMISFLNAALEADLMVLSGGGFINDIFSKFAMDVLGVLNIMVQRNIPTAMLGQGIGPIGNPDSELYRKAKSVIQRVDFIFIRENRTGLALLQSLNVQRSRIVVTGDDAIELAYKLCPERLGKVMV